MEMVIFFSLRVSYFAQFCGQVSEVLMVFCFFLVSGRKLLAGIFVQQIRTELWLCLCELPMTCCVCHNSRKNEKIKGVPKNVTLNKDYDED